jgi:4-carboxymuconolactone decarboxylase
MRDTIMTAGEFDLDRVHRGRQGPVAGRQMAVARFPELRDEELDGEQRRVAAAIRGGPRGGLAGPFVPLLYNPMLADRVQSLGAHLRFECSLPEDLKELAIIVTARHWTAQFEWYAHRRLALAAGISDEIVAAIAEDRRPDDLSPERAAVYDFCIELHEEGRVSAPTFQRALDHLDHGRVMELIGLCGYYTLIAMVLNVAEVPIPDGEPTLGRARPAVGRGQALPRDGAPQP